MAFFVISLWLEIVSIHRVLVYVFDPPEVMANSKKKSCATNKQVHWFVQWKRHEEVGKEKKKKRENENKIFRVTFQIKTIFGQRLDSLEKRNQKSCRSGKQHGVWSTNVKNIFRHCWNVGQRPSIFHVVLLCPCKNRVARKGRLCN